MNHPTRRIRRAAFLFLVGTSLGTHVAAAQQAALSASTEPLPTAPVPAAAHGSAVNRYMETSVSLGATGQFTVAHINETKTDLTTQSISPSAGLLFTIRQTFKPWLGFAGNFGYTRAMYHYTDSASAPNAGTTVETFIPNNVYETSFSYIATGHLTSRLSLFGEAGGGALGFASINRDIRSKPNIFGLTFRSNTFRPVAISGFGMEYLLGHGLALRGEYRVSIAKYPDYASDLGVHTTAISQPALSLSYRFGKH